jgi:hypothetical protein
MHLARLILEVSDSDGFVGAVEGGFRMGVN